MKRRFPKSPSIDDFSYLVQTKTLNKEEFRLLSQFIVQYQRLYLGSCLLPDLVRLYQWLHQEMAHSVTIETASKITLNSIKKQLKDTTSDEMFQLYTHIIGMWLYNMCIHYFQHNVEQMALTLCALFS